jgi:hypothetical protein
MSITAATKSNLFKRAWQIVRVNNDFNFSAALKLAWSELKEFNGQTPYFWVFDPIAQVKAKITTLENTTRLGVEGHKKLAAAYAELSALRAAA